MMPERPLFLALLAEQYDAGVPPELARLVRQWPQPFLRRLLATLPTHRFIAACRVLPDAETTARVAVILRSVASDIATRHDVFERLAALHAEMPARAMTLRRMMEWEADDAELLSRCFPDLPPWPEDKHERAIAVALRAEAHWPALPLPCVYRFPGPLDLPDAWPDATNARPAATPNPPANPFPNAKDELPSSPLAAAIEWLHLARLDRALGQRIASAFPPGEGARWQAAALSLTDPQGHTPIPAALADFESLWHDEHRPAEQKTSALSRTEVDALLCCADDDPDCLVRSPETRAAIHEALLGWLAWIDESGPLTRQMSA